MTRHLDEELVRMVLTDATSRVVPYDIGGGGGVSGGYGFQ
jgi:hypothetical protein